MSEDPWAKSKGAKNNKAGDKRPRKPASRFNKRDNADSGDNSDKRRKPSRRSDTDSPRRRADERDNAYKKSGDRSKEATNTSSSEKPGYKGKRREDDRRPRGNNGATFKDRKRHGDDQEKTIEKPRNPLILERKKGLEQVDTEGVVEVQGDRLQKVLANHDFGSRRDIEKLMLDGDVLVNDEIATLGMRVIGGETVLIKGKEFIVPSVDADKTEVLIYHKPVGQICSREDAKGRVTVFDSIPKPQTGRWVMVGRLDINTSGLLIFTNNGALANTLMHPSNEVLRRYRVRVFGDLPKDAVEQLLNGVQLEDGPAHFEECEFVAGRGNNRWYNVSLREGRNREVRRMWEAVGGTVSRLIRVAYGPITLPESLKHGECRWATQSEMKELSTLADFDLSTAVIGDGTVHKVEPEKSPREWGRDNERSNKPSNRQNQRSAKSRGDGGGYGKRGGERHGDRGGERSSERSGERPKYRSKGDSKPNHRSDKGGNRSERPRGSDNAYKPRKPRSR